MSSNLFLSNNLEDALRLTETPTNTYFKNQDNDVTSDVFMSQINSKNINDLVSMLTSENNLTNKYNNTNTTENFPHVDFTLSGTSENLDSNLTSTIMPHNITLSDTSVLNTQRGGALTSTTDTEQLENQLRKLLGGGKTRKSKKTSRKRKSRKSKSKKSKSKKSKSKKSSTRRKSRKSQTGGAKRRSRKSKSKKTSTKRKSKKTSTKRKSKKGSKKRRSRKMKGGNDEGSCPPCPDKKVKKKRKPNPGFMAFQKLKKHVAEGLGIPNSVKAAKAAGAALRYIKEAHPDIDSITASNKAMKEFDDNKDKYAKFAK